MSYSIKAKRLLINKVVSARQDEKKCCQAVGPSAGHPAKTRRVQREDSRLRANDRWETAAALEAFWKFSNIEYEGKSHDVVENKGPIFISHDVYDK
jgi:hypothetical protein